MSGEDLRTLEIHEPGDEVERQLPTRDVPTGKGLSLGDEGLVRSTNTLEDVQKALGNISQANRSIDNEKK